MIEPKESTGMPAQYEHHDHDGHPLAVGLLAGAAAGVGLGLLFAPRKGSDMRHQIADGARHVAGSSHDIYCACRDAVSDAVSHGASATRRYVNEMSEALRGKAHGTSSDAENIASAPIPSTAGEFGRPVRHDGETAAAGRA